MYSKISKIVMLSILSFTGATLSANAMASGNVGNLAGTWEIQGTPDPANQCGVTPFVNLASITRDGKVVNVDPEIGTGVGEGYRIKGKHFAIGFFGFIPTPQGTLRYEVQGSLKLVDKSNFTGLFRTTLFDPAFNPICVYEGSIAGFRQVAMPY